MCIRERIPVRMRVQARWEFVRIHARIRETSSVSSLEFESEFTEISARMPGSIQERIWENPSENSREFMREFVRIRKLNATIR